MRTYIFGAGASKAEKAPLANELLYKTLTHPQLRNYLEWQI